MCPVLSKIFITQSLLTTLTLAKCKHLLDYIAWYPNATIRFNASNMFLNIDYNAAYLVLPRVHSRLAGYFFLRSTLPPTFSLIVQS